MFRAAGEAVSARTACSTEANGPRSTLAAPSIPVSPAATSRAGWVASARSRPLMTIRTPATARVARRPMRAARPALTSPDREAAARPTPTVRPISPGGRPRFSRCTPMRTAAKPNPNARRPRAASSRARAIPATPPPAYRRLQADGPDERDEQQKGDRRQAPLPGARPTRERGDGPGGIGEEQGGRAGDDQRPVGAGPVDVEDPTDRLPLLPRRWGRRGGGGGTHRRGPRHEHRQEAPHRAESISSRGEL